MNKKLKKLLSLIFVAVILTSTPSFNTLAAEEILTVDENVVELEAEIYSPTSYQTNPDIELYTTTFVDASISVGYTSEGMVINILTATNRTASYVGVKDIQIQKKVWYGWTTVATGSGGASYNTTSSGCRIVYSEAVKGETYRVLCTHYADVDGYHELGNNSGECPWK